MRTWKQYYTVLSGPELCFYKDRKDFQQVITNLLSCYVAIRISYIHNYNCLVSSVLVFNDYVLIFSHYLMCSDKKFCKVCHILKSELYDNNATHELSNMPVSLY